MSHKEHQVDSTTCDTEVLERFPVRPSEFDRFKSGKKHYFEVTHLKTDGAPLCLDIACGAKPFPEANILCDLHAEPVPDRNMKALVTGNKPFVLCSCSALPFKDQAFDFVTSYYLIEHVPDPWSLVKELKRVSKHGYIQAPSWINEFLYGEKVHYWMVIKRDQHLYVKAINDGALPPIRFGFVFHRLYEHSSWKIVHAILDELFHIFSVDYSF